MEKGILVKEGIVLNVASESKDKAIERVGKLLINGGYVKDNYIEGMKAREEEVTTYMGKWGCYSSWYEWIQERNTWNRDSYSSIS